jgi:hypothetical protein
MSRRAIVRPDGSLSAGFLLIYKDCFGCAVRAEKQRVAKMIETWVERGDLRQYGVREASAAPTVMTPWAPGLRLIRDCIAEAILTSRIDHRVAGDGPAVKATTVQATRAVHKKRFVSNGDGDREAAERKAWSRNFKAVKEAKRIAGEVKDGQELIWLVATEPSGAGNSDRDIVT